VGRYDRQTFIYLPSGRSRQTVGGVIMPTRPFLITASLMMLFFQTCRTYRVVALETPVWHNLISTMQRHSTFFAEPGLCFKSNGQSALTTRILQFKCKHAPSMPYRHWLTKAIHQSNSIEGTVHGSVLWPKVGRCHLASVE